MRTLQKIWDDLPLKSDKGNVHGYLPIYEDTLAPYRETAEKVLEIGLFNGYSLPMWKEYFSKAEIHGIDYSEMPLNGMGDLRQIIAENKYHIHIMDACDTELANAAFKEVKFNVILEDANHDIEQQVWLYSIYKNFLADDGIYIIEDIQDIDKTQNVIIDAINDISPEKEIVIVDNRMKNMRYDDVLVIIKNKK